MGFNQAKNIFIGPMQAMRKGISLGNKETFVTPEQGSEPTWIEAQPSATKDWWISFWFGSFYQNPNGWALHEQLGWIFPSKARLPGYGFGKKKWVGSGPTKTFIPSFITIPTKVGFISSENNSTDPGYFTTTIAKNGSL